MFWEFHGGPDSIAMLDILRKLTTKLNFNIIVAHVNHMLRTNAILDEEYVEKYCNKYKIPFYLKREDVKKQALQEKKGTEEMGRKIRYDFFLEVMEKEHANKIATAHNKNDNAETVLMNVLRGSSVSGLKGIERKRDYFIRPLIDIERRKIEKYCKEQNLEPKQDETNSLNIYTRNKIRNVLIPYIQKEFNPNIIETLNRLSELALQEDKYMTKQVIIEFQEILEKQNENEIVLNLNKFNKMELVIQSRVILYTIQKLLGTTKQIEKIHINDIIKLCNNNIGNKYLMPNKNIKILLKNKKIFFNKTIK